LIKRVENLNAAKARKEELPKERVKEERV